MSDVVDLCPGISGGSAGEDVDWRGVGDELDCMGFPCVAQVSIKKVSPSIQGSGG